ncbi:MAG: LbtU family siderophore porin [Desulfurivibrionaceae bacterium]
MNKNSWNLLMPGIFLVSLTLNPVGGQALAREGDESQVRVRELISQNQNLERRLKRIEEKLSQKKKSVNEASSSQAGGRKWESEANGFLTGLGSRIDFSGLVEFGGAWQEVEKVSGDQEEESDLALTTVELAIGAEVSPWVNLETVLLYEDPTFDQDESSIDLDVAALTLGNTERYPFYLSAGKMYVPFGALLTHMPDDPLQDSPLTLAMGEASEKAVLLGLDYQGLSLSGYAFNGDVEESSEDKHIDGYGFDVNYSASFPVSLSERVKKGEKYPHGKTMEMDLLVGASYISNIAESDGLTEVIGGEVEDYVAGYAAYLHTGYRGLFLDAEYMTAADEFEVNELSVEGQGAQPSVWNLETGFNYDWGKNLEVVFNYAGSDEAGGLGFPERRYGLNFNQEISENTVISLGYFNDSYENDDIEGRDERNLVFSQIAVEF